MSDEKNHEQPLAPTCPQCGGKVKMRFVTGALLGEPDRQWMYCECQVCRYSWNKDIAPAPRDKP